MYLSGVKNNVIADDLASGRIGFLKTPAVGNSLDGVAVWAVDNGAFTGRYPGDDAYMTFLHGLSDRRDSCLFVAVPDVIGDAQATLALFPGMAARIRSAGWPVALVAQDGMTPGMVPWRDLDWLFIGGSTGFKLGPGAEALIRRAQRENKKVHVGRVNSGGRFKHFRSLGCDTADGTYLAYGPDILAPRLRRWIDAPHAPMLWGGEA